MAENSRARDGSDVSRSVRRITNGIYRNLFRTNIFDDVGGLFEDQFNIIESQPLVTRPKTSDAGPIIGGQSNLTTPVTPVAPIELPGGGTLSPTDRSQLAKTGDIDITETLARRA